VCYGGRENERDKYEFAKLATLKDGRLFLYRKISIYSGSESIYKEYFSGNQRKMF